MLAIASAAERICQPAAGRAYSGVRLVTRLTLLGLTFLLATPPGPTWGQEAGGEGEETLPPSRIPVPLTRISESIRLDGVLDEPIWDTIEPLPFIMWSPVYGGDMTERTEVRLAYDDAYLYVGGRMYDGDPEGIRINTYYRDVFSGDDLLSIEIDSYNDFETALWFVTNPAGVRSDRTMSNDGEFGGGTFPMNADWNAHWDVATSRNEEGWFAEFRIPFSTLGFQVEGDEVTMGVIVYRFIARKNERHLFPAISRDWGGFGFGKPSQAQRVTMRDVRPAKPAYITPYVLGRVDRTPFLQEASEGPGRWRYGENMEAEPGLGIKYSPSSNLAIDLTVNTDFAQVEADNQQLNLTRFSLFFPEKRQFFQERASTFDFGTGGFTDRLFFSRQIGLERGTIVPIYGGARFVGRVAGLDYGALNMQTAPTQTRSGENMGVVRLKQQVLNPYSFVGGMVTTRLGDNGDDNIAFGLDARIRPIGDEYITLTVAQTLDEAVEEGSLLDAGLFRALWERQTDRGLAYSANFRRVGPDYKPRLGFQSRRDFTQLGGSLSFTWFQGDESALNSITVGGMGDSFYRNVDYSPESQSFGPEIGLDFRNGSNMTFSTNTQFESIEQPFSIGEVRVEEGKYWFTEAEFRWMLPRSALLRGDISGSAGDFYDGRRLAVSVNPTWTISRYAEIGGVLEVNRIEFPDRDIATTAQLAGLRLNFAFNPSISISSFAQYNNINDQVNLNVRFRYHFREGTDLWVVYNDGVNVERERGLDLRLPFSTGSTLMFKYSHTFPW